MAIHKHFPAIGLGGGQVGSYFWNLGISDVWRPYVLFVQPAHEGDRFEIMRQWYWRRVNGVYEYWIEVRNAAAGYGEFLLVLASVGYV
jgi:hypothetical protein